MTPLLAPKSIALVGGSPRQGSVGNGTIKSLLEGRYPGELSIINPRHEEVEGLPCFASLADLAQPPDMAILSVAAHRMEKVMTEAIEADDAPVRPPSTPGRRFKDFGRHSVAPERDAFFERLGR